MTTSDQLARQAAVTREQLSRTIDELRLRTSPAQLIDGVAGYLRDTGERMVPDATGTSARSRYMLPLALIGAGVAWLALEARRSERAAADRYRADGKSPVLTAAETEVIASPAPPTVAPDQGATLRPTEVGSIAPESRPSGNKVETGRTNADSDQRPLAL